MKESSLATNILNNLKHMLAHAEDLCLHGQYQIAVQLIKEYGNERVNTALEQTTMKKIVYDDYGSPHHVNVTLKDAYNSLIDKMLVEKHLIDKKISALNGALITITIMQLCLTCMLASKVFDWFR